MQPPFTLKFRDMSDDDLRDYRRWLFESMPPRLVELQGAVNSDPNFRTWKPDHSRASIEALGQWLSHQVETRARTAEEIDRIKGSAAFDFSVPAEELTNRTFSLAMDAGMYFGEALRSQYPHLKWDQPLKNKKFADFGQVVLVGFGRASLNPVRILVTYCYGIASGKQIPKRLDEVYGYWSSLAHAVEGAAKAT